MKNEEKYTADELRIIKFFVSEFTAEELPQNSELSFKNYIQNPENDTAPDKEQ